MKVKDKALLEDLEYIVNSDVIDFEKFRDKNFLITGATGLIGSLVVKSLIYASNVKNLNINVVALVRNLDKANEIYSEFIKYDSLEFYKFDLNRDSEIHIEKNIDFIIHGASVTASKVMVNNPVDTIKTALNGTSSILDFAVKQKKLHSMIYVSSMEVYGIIDNEDKIDEKTLGYIDLQYVRSCYPEGKRMCECMCSAYASQYNLNVISARLAQTFGAGILPGENRVFAQFAKSVINNKDIVLHTYGKSQGNYVYTKDAVMALLMLLYKGKKGEPYNIVNEESHTSIAEMAQLVSEKIANEKIKVIFNVSKEKTLGYAPDTKLKLSGEKMQELGWKPTTNLEESYRKLIKSLEIQGGTNE